MTYCEEYRPSKFKRGAFVVVNGEIILICPYCGNQGTDKDCKDFTLITLGYYVCNKCKKQFTILSTDWRENVKIVWEFLNPEQKRAVDTISKDSNLRKK